MVGAGPTGLSLALQVVAHGAAVRVVDRRTGAFRPSRALLVHPRTLEVLRPLGVTDELLARADTSPAAALWLGGSAVSVSLAELPLQDTAFPHLTLLRQADVEDVLTRALERRGVTVERGTELIDVVDAGDGGRARLRTPTDDAWGEFAAVVGCDGVDSTVRARLGISWPGGTYPREVVLADLDLTERLDSGVAHVAVGQSGLVFLFGLGEHADWRLLATRACGTDPPPPGQDGPPLPADELQGLLDDARLPVRIASVAWSTRVRVQHRVAVGYGRGRVFLAGDAAHASSPAGGTGMNTGIQDATNLGWKLALIDCSADAGRLLGSYEKERRPVALQVLALTRWIFWAESSADPAARTLRGRLAPLFAPALPLILRRRHLVAEGYRLLAQLRVAYPDSPLSVSGDPPRPGRPRPGDRLPDRTVTCGGRTVRLHDLLAHPGVHVLVDRNTAEPPDGHLPGLDVLRLQSSTGHGVVAVRPDGHVGFTSARSDWPGLRRWLRLVGTADREEAVVSVRPGSDPSPGRGPAGGLAPSAGGPRPVDAAGTSPARSAGARGASAGSTGGPG